MTLIVKIHSSSQGKIVCVTDSSLIGKKFEDGKRQLDFSSNYYKGEEKSADTIGKILTSAYLAVFSGKNSVALGEKVGVVDEKTILIIGKIPHAQCLIG
jgi:hypothetical protein